MKVKVAVIAALLAVMTMVVPATAQSGKFDAYVGIPWQHAAGSNFYGYEASGTYNLNSWLGLTLDGAQTFNHGTNSYIVAGPTFSLTPLAGKYFKPFVGAYMGTDITPVYGGYNSGLSWLMGGGFDVPLSKRISLRPVNLNYYGFNHHIAGQSITTNSLWYSGGIVLHF